MKTPFSKIPLGLPLAGLGLATAASVARRPVHVAIGGAWLLLSALHGMQHAEKLKKDASRLASFATHAKDYAKDGEKAAAWAARNTYLHVAFAGTEVVSALPGRVRLRNKAVVGNDELSKKLTDFLTGFDGVTGVVTDLDTGSVTIFYDEAVIDATPKLAAIRRYFENHAKITA